MAVGHQGRAFDMTLADDGERALGVLPDGGDLAIKVGQRGVEQHCVLARQQVAGQAQERPEDHVAMRIAGANLALSVEEHEPLRPVAIGVLGREHLRQQRAHRRHLVERQQHFERALADIARAPAAAGELLQPARRQEVDQRVVAEPGQDVDQALGRIGVRGVGRDRQLRQGRRVRRCGLALHQAALDAQPEIGRHAAAEADKGQGTGLAKQQLGSAHLFER